MGSNIVFSLNATIPLFLVMALGYFLKKINIIRGDFESVCNKLNFTVTLPVLLFTDLAGMDIRESFDLKFVLFCAGATTIGFFGIWGLSRLFMKDKSDIGEFVQVSYRSSAAVMGLALIQNIYGTTGMAGLMMLGCVPLYNIFAVIVLEVESSRGSSGKGRAKKVLLGIIKNPIIIGIILGMISSLLRIQYPTIIATSLNYIARIATPLALLCIGVTFEFKDAFGKIGKSATAAIIKLIILPVVFVPVAILMGFGTEKLVAIFVMLAGPSTPSCYIMARSYGYDGILTSSTVVLTTLFSSVTLTVFIFILRSMGYI